MYFFLSYSLFFIIIIFKYIILPSLLSCNPSVFCMTQADHGTCQRTQNAIWKITFSFFDRFAENVSVYLCEDFLLFLHTHYKHLFISYPFSLDYRIVESNLWQKSMY